jgi:tetratricopeptide (TPR) repeat protein
MLNSEILVSKKEFETALSLLISLEKEEPNAPMVHYFKGLSHLGLGDINKAAQSVSKAVELKPDLVRPRLLLADIYLRQRSFQPAVELASKILETNESIYPALMIRANAQMGLGKVKAAEQDYEQLIETDPNNPAGYYRLALLLSSQKQYDKSEKLLEKAQSINQELIDVFSLRVRNNILLKNFEQAHNLCQEQLKIAKGKKRNLAIVYNVQGSVYLVEKNPKMAAAALQNAIEIDPDYLRSYGSLAQIFIAQKDLKSAISQYETILEKNPGIVSPHMMLGTLFEMEENYDAAEEHYRKALEIDPKFAPAANNLAYHLAERTDKFDEALKYARIAKEQLPEDPGVMDTIGWAYYRKGLYGNAVDEFTESLKSIPENPVVHYHLGLAYHKKGNVDLAKKELAKALELNKNFPGADEAGALLKSL